MSSARLAYTRGRIAYIFDNYLDVFDTDAAERSMHWAEVNADIHQAVRRLPSDLRLLFRLHCLQGLSSTKVFAVTGWSGRRYARMWRQLVDGVHGQIGESRCYTRLPHGRGPIPVSYAYGFEGAWPDGPPCTCHLGADSGGGA